MYHSGFSKKSPKAYTLEGQVVKYSDKIAYVNHDIDDSIRARLLFQRDIPKDLLYCLGNTHGERINILVIDCIKNTLNNIEKGLIEVSLSDEKESALYELRKYLFKKIYNGKILKTEREKAKFVLKQVFDYFVKNPEKMPKLYKSIAKEEGLYIGAADYIAGMSDDYCLHLFNSIYVPKVVIY